MTPPLVHVEWKDARSVDAWTPGGDIDIAAAVCQTIGFLVKSDPDAIAVAGSIEGENACCVMVIPRAMIVTLRDVKVGCIQQVGLEDNE